MAYFPFFAELAGARGLIVGGGMVALRKAEKLLPYGPALTLVAPEFCPSLAELAGRCAPAAPALMLVRRTFAESDVTDGLTFVIAATDDRALNHRVAALCRERRIPVNVVDDAAACTFLFPALVQAGPLSVGISTAGASPTAAIWLKEQLAALLPEGFDDILAWLEAQRAPLKDALPDEPARAKAFKALFAACMAKGAPLSDAECADILCDAISNACSTPDSQRRCIL